MFFGDLAKYQSSLTCGDVFVMSEGLQNINAFLTCGEVFVVREKFSRVFQQDVFF